MMVHSILFILLFVHFMNENRVGAKILLSKLSVLYNFLVEWDVRITFGSSLTLIFQKFDQVPRKKP